MNNIITIDNGRYISGDLSMEVIDKDDIPSLYLVKDGNHIYKITSRGESPLDRELLVSDPNVRLSNRHYMLILSTVLHFSSYDVDGDIATIEYDSVDGSTKTAELNLTIDGDNVSVTLMANNNSISIHKDSINHREILTIGDVRVYHDKGSNGSHLTQLHNGAGIFIDRVSPDMMVVMTKTIKLEIEHVLLSLSAIAGSSELRYIYYHETEPIISLLTDNESETIFTIKHTGNTATIKCTTNKIELLDIENANNDIYIKDNIHFT